MIFPISDDNSGRGTTPVVTYLLIAVNVLVFVFLQGLGGNDDFTYKFSTVPEEIVTGQDVVTRDRVVEDHSGQRFRMPGLGETPV
ncbi:MAG: rhomboid family intramembrane serine protease, partial [Pyrinomonadaceae bacterium]